ncbi:hypothetical protein RQP46_005413 [Phenoliferia psychrophenolica]
MKQRGPLAFAADAPFLLPLLGPDQSDPITQHLHLQRATSFIPPHRHSLPPLDAPPLKHSHDATPQRALEEEEAELELGGGDVWSIAAGPAPPEMAAAPRVLTWDALRPDFAPSGYSSPFLTEASSAIWEAEIASQGVPGTHTTPYSRETLVENLLTVAIGLESPLFAWDATAERFDWRQDANGKGKGARVAGRLWGSSPEASASLIEPFLHIGSCLVRLEAVVKLLTAASSEKKRATSTSEVPIVTSRASHAVATSLSTVVHWARASVAKLEPPPPPSPSSIPSPPIPLIALSTQLSPIHQVCTALTTLFHRSIPLSPPYPSLPSTSSKLLSHLYDRLRHHLEYSLTPPLFNQAVVAWVLHDAVKGWWARWEAWVEGAAGTQWDDIGIESRTTGHKAAEFLREVMVLEEDEPVTYVLRTAALPTFFPRRIALELFEAGRSFRLLRRSKPGHPVCHQVPHAGGGRGLLWSEGEASDYLDAMLLHAAHTRQRIASWRSGRDLLLPLDSTTEEPDSHENRRDGISSRNPLSSKYNVEIAALFSRFDLAPNQPSAAEDDIDASRSLWRGDKEESSMLSFLAHVLPPPSSPKTTLSILPLPLPSLDILIDASLYAPLRALGRLPSTSLLTLFFSDLSLQTHLTILHSYFLLGDQSFARRLREALFAPPEEREGSTFRRRRRRDQVKYGDDRGELGEERLGWGAGMGIHLNDREAWPPGGAELSLVLRTVLDDSLEEARERIGGKKARTEKERKKKEKEVETWSDLEARLSFAYREGESEEEEARWSDANSLSALDFLIVDYKAPSPLHLVLTPSILSKYNRIFSSILRLTRIEAITRSIWSDISKPNLTPSPSGRPSLSASPPARVLLASSPSTQRALQSLAFELRGLVNGLSDFSFGTIRSTYATFRRAVDSVERASHAREQRETVDDEDENDGDEPAWNLDSLMSLHAHFLDRILEALFIRGPNEHLRRTIEDGIFGVVLRLGRKTKEWRRREGGPAWDVGAVRRDILAMHQRLRSEAASLIKALQALEGQGGIGSPVVATTTGSRAGRSGGREIPLDTGAGSIQELLVRLDANRFYSGPRGSSLVSPLG